MENTTVQRMVMRVRIQDVSNRSSAIEYVGQGTWFDGKSFIVAQYKAKEMEKERMIKFCIDWFISREMNIKEYYEQTYGEGEQ